MTSAKLHLANSRMSLFDGQEDFCLPFMDRFLTEHSRNLA
jgi:hypothetical protein